MIRNNLIIMPSSNSWEWSADYVRQTAMRLSKENIVVVFLWSEALSVKELVLLRKKVRMIYRLSANLTLFQAIYWLPFKRFGWVVNWNYLLNIWLLKLYMWWMGLKTKFERRVLWIFNPYFFAMYKQLGGEDYLLYDCVDYFVGSGDALDDKRLKQKEATLLKKADLVVANSKVLQQHCNMYRDEVHLVPQGFDMEVFECPKSTKVRFPKKPVIGYVGGINYRLDYQLLFELIERNPKWQFVLWGPVQGDDAYVLKNVMRLKKFENVVMGESPRSELPGVIAQFDVGIIPYNVDQKINKYCYPMKVFEYFYMGKPVVSTPIEELRAFPDFVKIGDTVGNWEGIIHFLDSKSWLKEYQKEQKIVAIENSWDNKIIKIGYLIADVVGK